MKRTNLIVGLIAAGVIASAVLDVFAASLKQGNCQTYVPEGFTKNQCVSAGGNCTYESREYGRVVGSSTGKCDNKTAGCECVF